jgi:putative membrane protein
MKWLARWWLLACALLLVAQLVPTIQLTGFSAALWTALAIGLLNGGIRPLLIVLTLPVTLITLGLFLFVINALIFWLAARLLDGFSVADFGSALVGSLLYSLLGLVIDSALERLFPRRQGPLA